MDRQELKRAVLTAPLWMQSTKSSSRLVAEAVGVSQSLVARTWQEFSAPEAATDEIRAKLAERRMVLVGFAVGRSGSCLVLKPSRTSRAQHAAGLAASSRRRLRAVLAADLLRNDEQKPESVSSSGLWTSLESKGHSLAGAMILVSGGFAVPDGVRPTARFASAWQWQRLIAALDLLTETSSGPLLVELEWRLRRWHQGPGDKFIWTADRPESPAAPRGSSGDKIMFLESGSGLDEDILAALRQGLVDGTFSGESEITVGKLSRLLGVAVRDVRASVRALTEDGLVTAARSDSIVVRIPSLEDASETYMARRALGAIAVRAASRWTPESRSRIEKLLEDLAQCVRRDDITKAHYLDMDFQIAVFEASGLNRIPAMLETLTKQAFMHFAVIGARYAFSPEKILEQNTEIFEAISSEDLRSATLSWQTKMDDGLNYVAQHIAAMKFV